MLWRLRTAYGAHSMCPGKLHTSSREERPRTLRQGSEPGRDLPRRRLPWATLTTVGNKTGEEAMERAVVLGAARTPFGKFGGALSPLGAPELGGAAIRDAIDRSGIEDGDLQHSIFGIVVQAGVGQIPSRQANFHAGLTFSLTTETLNQVCASGLRSATLAETLIRAGDYDVIVAGGMESMSNAPYLLPKARWGARMGDMPAFDAMMHDGLLDAFEHVNMIRFGTRGAKVYDISREEQDAWALRSHKRAAAATDEGRLPEEIVGV